MLAALPLIGLFYRFTDELSENGKLGLVVGAMNGLLAGYMISTSYPLALMLSGLILGLLLANRFNTSAHRLGLGIAFLAVLYLGNPIVPPLPVIALALAAVGDQSLDRVREPFSILADTNIVLNALLVGYTALGILAIDSAVALILAEVAYTIGGIPFGSKKGKRYSVGVGR